MWKYRGQKRPPFADEPEIGGESVWDYPRPPSVSADSRRVVVILGERLLADSSSALRVLETASPPTFYLPTADVRVSELRPIHGQSVCEWKGVARYWALSQAEDGEAVAWDYPRPPLEYAILVHHVAFYPGRVECYVNDERVRPQPGRFYGGWITDEIAGPFKGEPGTGHW